MRSTEEKKCLDFLKYSALNIRANLSNLWHYPAIFLFVLLYYYFFTERLPWFWYDDVYWLERVEKTSLLALFKNIFNFVSGGFAYDRPVVETYVKFFGLFFGENPHYYRIGKMIIFSATVCLMFYLTVKHGGNKFITFLTLYIFATLPSAMIMNAPVTDTATLELLFKVCSFIVFFILISETEKGLSPRSILLSALLILLIIFADKSKATAKIIPLIFLTYLLLTRNKKLSLYIVILITMFTVFHFGVLRSAGSAGQMKLFYTTLLLTFLQQMWPVLIFVLIIGFLAKHRDYFRDKFVVFCALWLMYEFLFYILYPSDEMRYTFSSLAAASVLLSSVISNIFTKITINNLKMIARLGFVVVTAYLLVTNTWWSYNFRGSFASSHIIADKKMNFINQNFKNSLCLYINFTLPYYQRNTTNEYVNLNPRHSWNKKFDEIYKSGPDGIKILNVDKYENIIALDESLGDDKRMVPTQVFDSLIEDSLYDSIQSTVKLKIRSANLYNISLMEAHPYPVLSGIYKLK
jgi:hypothetical protein